MKRHEVGIFIGALIFAGLVALAMQRGMPYDAEAAAEAKKDLLEEPQFMLLHNAVYAKVGENRWVGEVRPELLRALTTRTIQATGNPFPSAGQITDWAKEHPQETSDLMKQYLKPAP